MKAVLSLPKQVFETIPELYPALVQLFRDSALKPPQVFALSYIKHYGKSHNGNAVLLYSTLLDILEPVLEYESLSGRTTFVKQKLVDKRFLERKHLIEEDRQRLFPEHGKADAVFLTEEGVKKLEEFNSQVEAVFSEFAARAPRRLLKRFVNELGHFLTNRK